MDRDPLYIVLADDDEADRLLFVEALDELEIKSKVHIVKNGMQLTEYLSNKNTLLPHVIFLDLNMPLKNGMECLKEIRKNKKFNEILIAIYSTSASENDINETFRCGANVYINKPSDFNVLKQLLNKVVTATFLYEADSFDKSNFLLRI